MSGYTGDRNSETVSGRSQNGTYMSFSESVSAAKANHAGTYYSYSGRVSNSYGGQNSGNSSSGGGMQSGGASQGGNSQKHGNFDDFFEDFTVPQVGNGKNAKSTADNTAAAAGKNPADSTGAQKKLKRDEELFGDDDTVTEITSVKNTKTENAAKASGTAQGTRAAASQAGAQTAKKTAAAGVKKTQNRKIPDEEHIMGNVYNKPVSGTGVFFGVLIAALVILLVVLAYNISLSLLTGSELIYDGINLNGDSISGLSKSEVVEFVENKYIKPVQNAHIIIKYGDNEVSYPLTDFVICPDADAIAEQAYNYARVGTKLERAKIILALRYAPKNITFSYSIVTTDINELMEKAVDVSYTEVVNPTYEIRSDVVVFTSGHDGTSIDVNKFQTDLMSALNEYQSSIADIDSIEDLPDITINIETTVVECKPLVAQTIYDESYVYPQDAYYYRNSKGEITVIEHTMGRCLNTEELSEMVTRINSGEQITYAELRYETMTPEIKTSELYDNLLNAELAVVTSVNTADSHSDDSDGGVSARAYNIKKAITSIGKIELLPGESLDITSCIWSGTGYKMVCENMADGGITSFGGGTAQLNSAIYLACLKSGISVEFCVPLEYYPAFGLPGLGVSATKGDSLVIKNVYNHPVKMTLEYDDETNEIKVTVIGGEADVANITVTSTKTKETTDGGVTSVSFKNVCTVNGVKNVLDSTTVKIASGDIEPGTATPTPEITPTPSEEPTPTPDGEATPTPDGEATPTPDGEATPTPDGEATPTPDGEATPTPDGETTPTPDEDPTSTPEITPTPSDEPTPTPTPSEEPTLAPEITPAPSDEPTPTPEPEETPDTGSDT